MVKEFTFRVFDRMYPHDLTFSKEALAEFGRQLAEKGYECRLSQDGDRLSILVFPGSGLDEYFMAHPEACRDVSIVHRP